MFLFCYCLVSQSYPTLCDPMDCSLPGFSVHGILQARILEWVASSFSRGIFLIQGSSLGLLYCRQILYCWATGKARFLFIPFVRLHPSFAHTQFILGPLWVGGSLDAICGLSEANLLTPIKALVIPAWSQICFTQPQSLHFIPVILVNILYTCSHVFFG